MNYKIFLTIVYGLFRKGYYTNPFLLYSQATHETGYFTSDIFKENNNIFGMKHPSIRETVSLGTNRGHAKYSSIYNSVIDYILRQREFNIKPQLFNNEQYINDTFNSNYAEDTTYKTRWNEHYDKLNITTQLAIVSLIVIFPLFGLFYLAYKMYLKWQK